MQRTKSGATAAEPEEPASPPGTSFTNSPLVNPVPMRVPAEVGRAGTTTSPTVVGSPRSVDRDGVHLP